MRHQIDEDDRKLLDSHQCLIIGKTSIEAMYLHTAHQPSFSSEQGLSPLRLVRVNQLVGICEMLESIHVLNMYIRALGCDAVRDERGKRTREVFW